MTGGQVVTYRLVLIEWLDSYGGTTGWKPLEDCTPDLFTCRSVGWLLQPV